ncbi:MAG: iron chaperone [Sediminibacterium sp.]
MNKDFQTVDEYIQSFPKKTQVHLKAIRKIIKSTAPEAVELIAYKMPAYKYNKKPLVYFAGYEKHIGLYATPSGHAKFKKELSKYKQGKGSVQFPIDEPMPIELIKQIVEFRRSES